MYNKYILNIFYLKFQVLTKISKEKDCDNLGKWTKPCERHLMWSATTTPSGDGELIWAKFESFLSHIINKHTDIPNENFNKCAHGEPSLTDAGLKKV